MSAGVTLAVLAPELPLQPTRVAAENVAAENSEVESRPETPANAKDRLSIMARQPMPGRARGQADHPHCTEEFGLPPPPKPTLGKAAKIGSMIRPLRANSRKGFAP